MVGKALAKRSEDRYQTASELLMALKKAITASPQPQSALLLPNGSPPLKAPARSKSLYPAPYCPYCSAETHPEDEYCLNCGNQLLLNSQEQRVLRPEKVQPDIKEALIAYCVKCKKKTAMQNAQQVTMKNGSPAVKGTCSVCGTGQYRVGKL